jgi:hypothetical protein
MYRGAAAPAEQSAIPHPIPARKKGRPKTSTSTPPGRLKKRVVPKPDGRYLIYYEKP